MNKWFLLLIVAGLAVAGWFNWDKITAFAVEKGYGKYLGAEPSPTPAGPNPAAASQAQAQKAYPALAIPGSPFNKKFLELYKASDPAFLTQPDWPMLLAERTAKELGGGAMPVPGRPTPPIVFSPPLGSALDPKHHTGATTPAPGGTALDQKPPSKH